MPTQDYISPLTIKVCDDEVGLVVDNNFVFVYIKTIAKFPINKINNLVQLIDIRRDRRDLYELLGEREYVGHEDEQ